MAKWAAITVILYIILVLAILLPVIFPIFDRLLVTEEDSESIIDIFEMLTSWQYVIFIAVVVVIQAALLFFPVKLTNDTLEPQRDIRVPIITTALLFSVLLVAIGWMILMAIFGDDALPDHFLWVSLALIAASWLLWSIIFARVAKQHDPKNFFDKLVRWLIKGSILELLIAVPSHILVRRRDECCAPGMTFLGITAGVAIMAVAFGPSVFFLFKKRFNQMKPRSKREP